MSFDILLVDGKYLMPSMEMIKKLLAIHQWWGFNVTLIIMKMDLLDIFLWKKFKTLEQKLILLNIYIYIYIYIYKWVNMIFNYL
ncbi:unnamed protein product [Brassica oleracea]|uniref:(rape) hypothetical protein n=1 Tax=Brassica napus TaxID=3708 RepID=A0A816U1E1_BRANA|nr:unnamed protein product [Brassica napus]